MCSLKPPEDGSSKEARGEGFRPRPTFPAGITKKMKIKEET